MNEQDSALRQKRYGQYFSGSKVAELLTALLPKNAEINTVIDPMAGIGDMLTAVKKKYSNMSKLSGIEIDKTIVETCRKNNPYAEIISGDAFTTCISGMDQGWDLVITNPPYIRYQLMNSSSDNNRLPSADTVRENLYSAISRSENLNVGDKVLFGELAHGYSGLSDIAVPAWILCASLVKQGGLLAMVVPDTWLNRDYAIPIQYLLLRCFNVLSITSDVSAAWFSNAQVKTCLVVAQRKKTISLSESLSEETYCMKLEKNLIGAETLVDKLKYDGVSGLQAIEKMQFERKIVDFGSCRTTVAKTHMLFPKLFSSKSLYRSSDICINKENLLPEAIQESICGCEGNEYETLQDKGWSIGQGLRTGANEFFYLTCIDSSDDESTVSVSWDDSTYVVSNRNLIVALHSRSEVSGLYVSRDKLTKRLLYIHDEIRNEDFPMLCPELHNEFEILNSDTAKYITKAEAYVPSGHNQKKFRERSAVITNERKEISGYRRFWYMLPAIKPRHTPCLCLQRVCGKAIECLLVEQSSDNPITVDANFITLWNSHDEDQMIALALLNSTWFKCYMESTSTVMGGGALKVEAAHIKEVLFPKYTEIQKHDLALCGEAIKQKDSISDDLAEKIDSCVLAPFGDNRMEVLRKLREKTIRLLTDRGGNHNEL